MKIKPYEHKAQYYETDQMGVIHHANYIKWFEEARVDYMEQTGMSYEKMEREGIMSPVLAVSCEYKAPVKFNQTVFIKPYTKFYNGIKLSIGYEITEKESGALCCKGETKHCFLKAGKPISLKKEALQFDKMFEDSKEEGI